MFKQLTLINYETASKESLEKNVVLYNSALKAEAAKNSPDFAKLNRLQCEMAEVKTVIYEKFTHSNSVLGK